MTGCPCRRCNPKPSALELVLRACQIELEIERLNNGWEYWGGQMAELVRTYGWESVKGLRSDWKKLEKQYQTRLGELTHTLREIRRPSLKESQAKQ